MSELRRIACAGAPRDLGLDQGRAARDRIRGVAPTQLGRRIARDLERFFPHHAERLQGISLGAGVPEHALLAPLADLLAGDAGFAVAVAAASGPLLARSLAAQADTLVLRESAPDNDYRSLELVPAGSPAAWIGVNEHGLAATALARPAPEPALAGCAAPAQLLVQDVLQRFDSAEKAADWALRRPAGGHASLLLADASGDVRRVEIEGRSRRLSETGAAALVVLGPVTAQDALEQRLAAGVRLDADALARAVAEASLTARLAVADPAGRRLAVATPAAPGITWHELSRAQAPS